LYSIFWKFSLNSSHLQAFLELVVGTKAYKPLPPPAERAVLLRQKGLEFIENWYERFGHSNKQVPTSPEHRHSISFLLSSLVPKALHTLSYYGVLFGSQLRVGYHYLKHSLGMRFPEIRLRSEMAERERKQKDAHSPLSPLAARCSMAK